MCLLSNEGKRKQTLKYSSPKLLPQKSPRTDRTKSGAMAGRGGPRGLPMQLQVKRNAEELGDAVRDLGEWAKTVKTRDAALRSGGDAARRIAKPKVRPWRLFNPFPRPHLT